MQNDKPLSKRSIEELKAILEQIHGRQFSYEEAAEVGRFLLSYVGNLLDSQEKSSTIKEHTT